MELNFGNKIEYSTTKTTIAQVSRSRTMRPHAVTSINVIGGTVLKEFDDLDILRVTFDSKMTFEKHLSSVSRSRSFSKACYLEKVLARI